MTETIFCHRTTPPLAFGDKLRQVKMNSTTEDMDNFVRIKKSDGFHGLYTSGMTYCVTLGAIKKNTRGDIEELAMAHFKGGLLAEHLQSFIKKIQPLFSDGSVELVIYGGQDFYLDEEPPLERMTEATIRRTTSLDKMLKSAGFEDHSPKFSKTYKQFNKACCISFDGYIGGFAYDNVNIGGQAKTYEVSEQAINLVHERQAFDIMREDLISRGINSDILRQIDHLIGDNEGHDATSKAHIYRLTRHLLTNIIYGQKDARVETRLYTEAINQRPLVPANTKRTCWRLGFTLIGGLIALPIAAISFFKHKGKRAEFLEKLNPLIYKAVKPRT